MPERETQVKPFAVYGANQHVVESLSERDQVLLVPVFCFGTSMFDLWFVFVCGKTLDFQN